MHNSSAPSFTGAFYLAGDPGFEKACFDRVFNERHPGRCLAAIVQAADVADVVAAVQFASEHGWQVAVRAGGHSWSVWSVRDHALLIDLGAFKQLDFDPATNVVIAGPAVRGGSELDPFLAGHGRFFNAGHCPTVGIGGFLLQGGMGWNCRGWGWAAEAIVAIDVVTAAGEMLHCDEENNSDLFWAARGAGPGFPAVVTAFHLATRPRFSRLTQSKYLYPAELAPKVFDWLYEARWDVPDSVELVAVSLDASLIPEIPYDGVVLVVDGVCFAADAEEASRALAPLATCPMIDQTILRSDVQPVELATLRADQIRANPEGHNYVVDCAYLQGDREDVVRALAPAFTDLPTPKAFTLWFDMGRVPQRGLPDMALSLHTDIYFAAYLVAEDEKQVEQCLSWIEDRATRLEPVKAGIYLGDSDLTRRPAQFMSDAAYARLQKIRADRDPAGMFCDYLGVDGIPVNTNPWRA